MGIRPSTRPRPVRLPGRRTLICLAMVATLATMADASAADGGPQWTIGRAVIVSARQGMSRTPSLHLKLSLRNVGVPGRIPVSIYGRWTAGQAMRSGRRAAQQPGWQGPGQGMPNQAGRWSPGAGMPGAKARPGSGWNDDAPSPAAHGGLPAGMRLLGRYVREVSLTNTAILEIPLPAMRDRNRRRLEIEVLSGAAVTDHRFIDAAD